jgi:hypothetical protein
MAHLRLTTITTAALSKTAGEHAELLAEPPG